MKKEEEKVCIGCGHIEGDNLGSTALACCPDGNFKPLREFINELWKHAYNSGSDNRKIIEENTKLKEQLKDVTECLNIHNEMRLMHEMAGTLIYGETLQDRTKQLLTKKQD